MNAVLKILVAAACCIVIAVGGLYLWRQWEAKQAAKAEAAMLQEARSELFRLSEAKPDETDKVRRVCELVDDNWRAVDSEDYARKVVNTCRRLGFL
ncbi:hypothetical protein FQ775_01195 [Nitratireductor mangrovi]|uniref:Uncharacterized protein n=1 Tax=Nitratireductor mangrovi TaxID=2599600 RepID=A0A5B8KU73_9HYPH|nr:hypothetical protein [Nitratireductor mangrovi]QDY99097.1 hypothetical protein FQ775_01195 [Nitratireductor mangrovi]